MKIQIHRIYDGSRELEDTSNDKVQITMSTEHYLRLKKCLDTAEVGMCLRFVRMLDNADKNSTYEFFNI